MNRSRRLRLAAAAATIAALTSGLATGGATASAAPSVSKGHRTVSDVRLAGVRVPDVTIPYGTPFGKLSVWRQDVRSAPLNGNSAAMVANVADQAAKYYGGVAAFNVNRYSTSFYAVPAGTARVDVRWDNCQKKTWTPAGLLGAGGQFSQVPIPAGAVPAAGTDGQLTVYSPDTDQLWEFWQAKKVGGTWQACWGGRIDKVSTSPGYFTGGFGVSASGLSYGGGTIGIKDVQAGSIDHAMALQLPSTANWNNFSWPAQRSDGNDTGKNAVPEGTRLRLDPSVDVNALKISPIAKMVAKAAQTYGFIVTDKAGAVAVVAESPAATVAATGKNPWPALMQGKPDYQVMAGFPWDRLQALPRDYGKTAAR